MSNIGGYEMMSINGPDPALAGYVLADITRPGAHGKALWVAGSEAQPFTVTSTSGFLTSALCGAAIEAYTALKGNPITYVDDFGRTWLNLWVRDVRSIRTFYAIGSTAPGINYILQCEWSLEHIR